MNIAMIGAGMAGLACGEALSRGGHSVTLFDKGRGPGGRMSTRRVPTALGEAAFDHGAQYFTVRDAGFAASVDSWVAQGCVAAWPAAGSDAFVGVPGMNAPIRQMAADAIVHWGTRVTDIVIADETGGWQIGVNGGAAQHADAVIIAVPAEQAAVLAASIAPAMAALAGKTAAAPCWTAMFAFAERLPIAIDCIRGAAADPLGWAARNNAKPGRSGPEAWIVQAGPDWSAVHLEDDGELIGATLLAALADRIGGPLPDPIAQSTHRWRYARSGSAGIPALWDEERRIGMCGDWLIGPRVEAAWLSGTALGAMIGNT